MLRQSHVGRLIPDVRSPDLVVLLCSNGPGCDPRCLPRSRGPGPHPPVMRRRGALCALLSPPLACPARLAEQHERYTVASERATRESGRFARGFGPRFRPVVLAEQDISYTPASERANPRSKPSHDLRRKPPDQGKRDSPENGYSRTETVSSNPRGGRRTDPGTDVSTRQ